MFGNVSNQYPDQQQHGHLKCSISKPNDSSSEKTFFENLTRNILLRQKNLKQLLDPQRIRKRFSDSILSHTPIQPQPSTPIHFDLHRRSFYLPQLPTIYQTNPNETPSVNTQKLFIIRHGERVDSTFGANWLHQVFDPHTGSYHRMNLNLPKKMITRKDYREFHFDPPLTELGLHQCKLVGEEFAAQGIKIDHVYSSPTLRCIQTADQILQGLQMRDQIPIRIEPCLFEFLKWYPVLPLTWPFLNNEELTGNGFNIDQSYKPFYPMESLRKDEDELMFYSRSHFITTSILKNHKDQQENILIIGHVSL